MRNLKSFSFLLSAELALALAGGARADEPATNTGLEEVVVTAQHHSENIQSVPAAISAIDGEKLAEAGITDASGLSELVPSVRAYVNATGTAIAIRGVMTNNPNPQGDPSLSFNVDDVYKARTQATGGVFYDVNRIEVLRGPQGTTYGRNAVAGVINVVTNDPVDHFDAGASLELGSYGLVGSTGMINVPVTEDLAVRAAFDTLNHEGYISDHFDDADDVGGRVKTLYRPNQDVSLLVTADYYHKGGYGSADVLYPYVNPKTPYQNSYYPSDYGNMDRTDWGLSARLTWDLGPASLTYIPSYQNFRESDQSGQLGALSHDYLTSLAYSQELRIASNDSGEKTAGTLQWLAGLFWYKEDQSYQLNIVQPLKPLTSAPPYMLVDNGNWPSIPTDSYAGYAQGTYSATDWFRLIGGLRYTMDDKSQNGTETVSIAPPFGPTIHQVAIGGPTNYNLSYKAMAEADVASNAMLYGGLTTGYHGGGEFDGQSPGNIYGPEKIADYELGVKSRWFDNRLQLNLDGYYYDYRNNQVSVLIPPFTVGETNAKSSEALGTELDLEYKLTQHDKISVSASYEFTDYTDYFVPARYSPSGGTPVEGGVSYDGEPFANTPRFSGTVGYQHNFDLADGSAVTAGVSSYMRSSYWTTTTHVANTYLSGYSNTAVNLTYISPDGKWTVNAYGRNLENKADPTSVGNASGPQLYASLSPPRTFGVRVSAKY